MAKVYVRVNPKPFIKPKPNKSKKFIQRLHHIKQYISHLPSLLQLLMTYLIHMIKKEMPERETTLSSLNLNYNYANFRGFLETLCFMVCLFNIFPHLDYYLFI